MRPVIVERTSRYTRLPGMTLTYPKSPSARAMGTWGSEEIEIEIESGEAIKHDDAHM
jgi:hypothetical protein